MNKTRVNAFCFIILMATILMFAVVALAAPVPDTGQSKCYNNTVEIPCPSPGQPFYGQDANYSIYPMSYTKLDGSGNTLPDSATSWVMVKDNVTGLVWEMKNSKDGKTDYNNPHDADNTYTWYDSNPATNGGYAGTPGTGTDTEDFIKALNGANYGGYSDWRMPTIKELAYIVNYSIPYPGPTIDTGYFPNTAASWYWSTHVDYTYGAWSVHFGLGTVDTNYKYNAGYVRAVRGGQYGPLDPSVISVSPASRAVAKDAGATTFSVSNTGTGTRTMPWTATVTSGDNWLLISSGASGTDSGTITCSFTANASSSARTATIRVTATGATGSPVDVLVTQAPAVQLVLSVTPSNQAVSKDAGTTTFNVSNTGTGTMPWTAAVTSGGAWLSISSQTLSGTNSGTISCSFTANTSTSARTGTIRVMASGATGSPKDVTVIQAPAGCTATLDGSLMLHIPALSYLNPYWGAPSFWAYFVYEYNPAYPALILFKMTNADIITAPTFSCKTSEISTLDDLKIHIPGLLLADGITHLSVDMEYSPAFSTNGNTCFVVTKYGVVPN